MGLQVPFAPSLLAEVSHDEAKWKDRRETSAGFRRVVWWSRRPNFWSKLPGFKNRFRLMCNARALLDCTLTIIEPTADYGFHEICEFRNFSVIKSSDSDYTHTRHSMWKVYWGWVSQPWAVRFNVSDWLQQIFHFYLVERELLAGKPLHPSLARRRSANRFLLKKKSPESQ